MRIGFGYDVHKLVNGRKLILGGQEIPYTQGLLGHSDADVVIHALMDSILGALALGDIGYHFPDTSSEYERIDSKILLGRVYEIMDNESYVIGNVDITVACEKPKLAPYILSMRETMSRILHCDISQISVKATTTERLGFEGRGEGISAYCVCLLNFKGGI